MRVEIQVPSQEVALRLRSEPGAQVVSRRQQRFIDDAPWSLQTSFYPLEYARVAEKLMMPDDIREGGVRYLQRAMGLRQAGSRDWITARVPDENETSFFGLAHDGTVFVIFRTGFDQNGKPMRVTATTYPADRNQFVIDSGSVPGIEYGPEAHLLSLSIPHAGIFP
jgi:GntR family transcriptional regulator